MKIVKSGPGRTPDPLLNILTIAIGKSGGNVEKYRCAGEGCRHVWTSRTKSRVFNHAKTCLLLPEAIRADVLKGMADSATGAQVAALAKSEPHTAVVSGENVHADSSAGSGLRSQLKAVYRKTLKTKGNHTLLCWWVDAGLAPHLLDSERFKTLCYVLSNNEYVPPTCTAFSEVMLPTEQAYVQKVQLEYLQKQRYLTMTFDGSATRRRHGFYTVHVNTADGREFLVDMIDGHGVSHTGAWIKEGLIRVSGDNVDVSNYSQFSPVARI